jgi:glutamine synthetase adenylyltransferase
MVKNKPAIAKDNVTKIASAERRKNLSAPEAIRRVIFNINLATAKRQTKEVKHCGPLSLIIHHIWRPFYPEATTMNTLKPGLVDDFEAMVNHASHCSRYIQRLLSSDPRLQPWLQENYIKPCDAETMLSWLNAMNVDDESGYSSALRNLRKKVMLVVLTRDLAGLATLDEVMASMTALAELAVQRAQASAMQTLVQQYGQPVGADSGKPQ